MTTIYLANLTHVNDGHYSSDYIPLNIGYLSAFTKTNLNVNNLDIKLFNLPDDLEKAMAEKTPDILATSSYGWSFQLNYFFLAHYKSKIPSIVTIMGGPNYPGTLKEQEILEINDILDDNHKTIRALMKRSLFLENIIYNIHML